MPVASTLRELHPDEAAAALEGSAALVDLRPVDEYLSDHVRSSLSLVYEQGPGLASRARDCLPLHLPLILIDDGVGDVMHAAASLRGKGFDVLGVIERAALGPGTRSASCEIARGPQRPQGYLLDVNDPGASSERADVRISIERLWTRAHDIAGRGPVAIAAGRGVRAALAVGILEGAGVDTVTFWFSSG